MLTGGELAGRCLQRVRKVRGAVSRFLGIRRGAAKQHPLPAAGASAHNLTCNILVVDSDPVMGEALVRGLTLTGRTVRLARSKDEALKLAESSTPVVIVVDLSVPTFGGLGLALALRERCGERPIFEGITAQSQELYPPFDLLMQRPSDIAGWQAVVGGTFYLNGMPGEDEPPGG